MANGSWKKALLPSLGSRRRGDRSASRPSRLLASNTVSDIHTTPPVGTTGDGAAPPDAALDVDDRLVSDLLETTAETNVNNGGSIFDGLPSQIRQFSRSHTVGAVTSSGASYLASSPQRSPDTGTHIPHIPHKSSKRNLRSLTRDVSAFSPGGSEDGLVLPLPTSQSVSSHFTSRGTHRITQSSSSMAGNTSSVRYKGDSPIRKGSSSPRKISHSVTSILASSQDYYTGNTVNPASPAGPLKSSRLRNKNVFAKFADVLAEHFTARGSRKGDKSTEPMETTTTSRETTPQIVHRQSLPRLSVNTPLLPLQDITNMRPSSLAGDNEADEGKAKILFSKAKAGSSTVRKRLTIVNEVDFQNGQPLEDPFSESSSGQHTTEFEARLKSRQSAPGERASTDPFQADHILETSVDAMLTTPPVGCSTPRRRPLSLSRCETPTHGSRGPDYVANLISFSPGVSSAEPERRRKIPPLRGRLRKENQSIRDSQNRDLVGKQTSRAENSTSSDSTRLSSYPPGSTIRHVPRSMGSLTEAPVLPESTVERTTTLPLGRKKHPSPSKGQLELFGKYMEKNLALGVFRDADELGTSFNPPHPGARTLSPRDTNQLMRKTPVSKKDLRKDYKVHGKHAALPKSRSRIPQPVRQLSRSRTDTAFARDFIPVNKGDSTMGDELQWDASAYKIGHRCNHCGSTNQIV